MVQDDTDILLILSHGDTVIEHECVEHKLVVVHHGRAAAICYGSRLLREHATLVGGTVVSVLHCADVMDGRGGVIAERAGEVVTRRYVT